MQMLDLVDVIQQGVTFLHLAYKKTWGETKNVRQTLRLVNNAKSITRLRRSFPTLDVCKVVVGQVKADDRYGLLDTFFVLLQHFGIYI